MSVDIRVKGNEDTSEYKASLILKQIFEDEFKDKNHVKGDILIVSNATLFGQETKDVDIVVFGNLKNYKCKLKSKARCEDNAELKLEERDIFFNNFCFVIETKTHRAEDIRLNGLRLLVKYNNKLSDATQQSENQKYSLNRYFLDRLNFSPYICNFIWLRNVAWDSLKNLLSNNEKLLTNHNYLPNKFSLKFLLQLACLQKFPYNLKDVNTKKPNIYSPFDSFRRKEFKNIEEIQKIFDLFETVKKGIGYLTRKKIEKITKRILLDQQYVQDIGEKLFIIQGRAGTGKTVKLLNMAFDLTKNRNSRCLILTYNHALVSDIKRILALENISDGIDTSSVSITTLHKYFYELLLGFNLLSEEGQEESKYIPDFIKKYDLYVNELFEYIDNGVIQEKDIQDLMNSRHDKVAWDYILIDEAQDWDENEKSILVKIFGSKKIIVTDGIDQMIRTQKKCFWEKGLNSNEFKKIRGNKGLRQEFSLTSFVNEFANEVGFDWGVIPQEEFVGGKIIVTCKGYTKELHNREYNYCIEKGNTGYEMLFLVPPKLVVRKEVINKYGKKDEERKFILTDKFNELGIDIWDGTNTDIRTQYPVDLNQHRLLQYESCRGLEGWTVVCIELDEFMRYKKETYKEEDTGELALKTFEQKRDDFVNLWTLIPLTRAIDTLIITIDDKKSDLYIILKKIYRNNPDIIEWIE